MTGCFNVLAYLPRLDGGAQKLFFLLLLVIAQGVSAQTRLALLTPTQSEEQGHDLNAAIETTLGVALSEEGLQLVEREALSKWLAEQELSASGLVRQPGQLKQVLGATHLLVIDTRVGAFDRKTALQLIEVASGNILAQSVVPVPEDADLDKLIKPYASRFRKAIEQEAQLLDRPTAVVLSVMDMSPHMRTQHFEPMIREHLESGLSDEGFRVLKRERADLLKEETRLGFSGLVRPDVAVLAEAADRVIRASFKEQTDPNLIAKNTPIQLKIEVQEGQLVQRHELTFTPATFETIVESIALLATRKLDADAESIPKPDRAKEIEKLMAEVRNIEKASPKDFLNRRIELCLEVLYLDPSQYEAYWYLTQSYWPSAMKNYGNKALQIELIDKHVLALERYLDGPRDDIRLVTYAYNALIRNALERQLAGSKDEQKRVAAYEKALVYAEEYVRWATGRGYDKNVSIAYGCLLPLGNGFHRWFRSEPGRETKFFEWVLAMHRENKSNFPKHAIAFLHKRAVDAYRLAGDDRAAADHYYMQTVGCGYKPDWYGGTLTGSNWEHPRDLEKLLSNMKAEHAQQVREVLEGVSRRLAPPPIQQMYGDFYGDVDELDRISRGASRILLDKADYPVLKVKPIKAPKNVVWTGFLEVTEAGLWVQGYGYDKGLITSDELYRLNEDGTWQTIKIAPLYGPHPNLQQWKRNIASLVQIGDDVLWAHSTHSINGGGHRPVELDDSLYHYKLSTGKWRLLGLKDGMPHPQVRCMRRGLGELADQVYIHTHEHFICRFDKGKIYIEDMRLKNNTWPSGMAIHDRTRFFYENGSSELWHANPENNRFKKLSDLHSSHRLFPVPRFVWTRGASGRGTDHRIAIVGDKVYAANYMGMLVTSLDGKVEKLWRPTRFFHWNGLGGYVEGNCPMPSAGVSLIMPDDQNPDLLWLVCQSPERVTSIEPDWEDLKARGHDTGNSRHISRHSSVATERGWRGLYITAFDTKRQLFSKPQFVKGPIVTVRPYGDQLYFTGLDLGTLPKSNWKCDQPGQADQASLRISVPDTLHGKASAALLKGDFEQARSFLKKAIDEGIAVEKTKKMLAGLRGK